MKFLRRSIIIPGIILLLLALSTAGPALAQLDKATSLIQAVNQLRASNGYYALQTNDRLMASAQGQSDYQATLGTWSHSGPGGTTVTQRAAAAGYGGGATVRCIENVAWGTNLTPQGAVDSWNDAVHLGAMLTTKYVDVGAGATTLSDGAVFYTLDICIVEGTSLPQATQVAPAQANPTSSPTTASAQTTPSATPDLSGAATYVVQSGDNLTLIANKFGITLDQLLKLNNLDLNSIIYPGQKLFVSPPVSPTPTVAITSTFTQQPPTPTSPPTRTPTATAIPQTPTQTLTATVTAIPVLPGVETDATGGYIVAGAAVLAVAGIVLIGWGTLLKRRS